MTDIPGDDRSGILELTGNVRDARELRANLAAFARQSGSPRIKAMVRDVLAGRRDVHDVFRSAEFNDVAARRFANLEAGFAALTDEERAEIMARAQLMHARGETEAVQERLDQARDDHDPDPGEPLP